MAICKVYRIEPELQRKLLPAPKNTREKLIKSGDKKRNPIRLDTQINQRPVFHIDTIAGRPNLTSIVKEVVRWADQEDAMAV